MKKNALWMAALSLAFAVSAHAGKGEREFYTAEVEPALKKAASALRQSCGCDVKMHVEPDSFQTVDHLRQVSHSAGTLVDNAPRYCNDAPSKATMCKLKTLSFVSTGTTTFKLSAGRGLITLEENYYPSWDMLVAELEK